MAKEKAPQLKNEHWIRRGRKRLGLSQANLSRVTQIVQAKISQWELGKSNPSTEESLKIRQVFQDLDKGKIPEGLLLRNHRRAAATALTKRGDETADVASPKPKGWFAPIHNPQLQSTSTLEEGPSVIACFSGCGGMSLGFRQAGYSIRGFVEIDLAARRTFQCNFPEAAPLAADICDIGPFHLAAWKKVLGPIDVLCGGPPCQGFSLAGKRDQHDRRNSLFRYYIGIAEHLKPHVVVMENVRLLTSMKASDGRLMTEHIREEFQRIGYNVKYQELNAQDFGVPQFRERVFFIAVKEDVLPTCNEWFPLPTHGCSQAMDLFASDVATYRTFKDATGDLELLESGEMSKSDPLHWAVKHPQHVVRWLRDVPEGRSAHENDDPALRPPSGYNTTYKRLRWDEPSSTIGTTFGMISACRTVHPTCTRSLTIREAMRCQTFPDEFLLQGNTGQIRKQIGNAVPPQLAFAIANHIGRKILRKGDHLWSCPESVDT